MAWPIPTLEALSEYSGRPAVSYTSYVNSALLQAVVMFTTLTELGTPDYPGMAADDQLLANSGVMAMADYLYLRWPYQQVIANPLQSETVGSYEYSKPIGLQARNAQAIEVNADKTGVDMFDLAVRFLSRRTRASGVFYGQITGFEHYAPDDSVRIMYDDAGKLFLVGPADRDQLDLQFFDINAPVFPSDPGV
jgi:hypothetical protein